MDQIFKDNPDLKECFQTSDGQSFYTKSDARNHAKTLEDSSIEHLVRPSKSTAEKSEKADRPKLTSPGKPPRRTKAGKVVNLPATKKEEEKPADESGDAENSKSDK